MSDKNYPKEPGYYWAATAGMEWCNAVVRVYGDSPFFKVEGYNFQANREVDDISQIHEFGSKIKEEGE